MTVADSMSLPQAAERLGVSRWTVRRQVDRTGEVVPGVKVFRLGSQDRVSRIQLEEFLRTGRVAS